MMLLYYGINDDGADPMTYRQIGKLYGVSHERIRQRVKKASNRLRLLHNTSPR
jgi:DNA-directed RNA polymerase sigma subunit (sigma70/sigma32)